MKSKVEYIKKDLLIRLVEVGVLDRKLVEDLSDDKLTADLEDIYTFKTLGFTDDEVLSIFIFKKLTKLTEAKWRFYKNQFYKSKSSKISTRIKSLQKTNDKLSKNIDDMKPDRFKSRLGVDISSLKYLRCVKCDGELILNNGSINNNHILEGSLMCRNCSEEYKIYEGIIFIGDKKKITFDGFEDLITKFVTERSTEELINTNNAIHWVSKKLPNKIENSTILEVGSELGLLLRGIYDKLSDRNLYIMVNDNIYEHYFIKQLLEVMEGNKNILFICCDYKNLPLVNDCADIVLDISSNMHYSSSETSNIILLNDYIKGNSIFIASYLLLNNMTPTDDDKSHFVLDHLKEEIKNQGYSVVNERLIGIKNVPMVKNVDKNTKLYNYMFLGKRFKPDLYVDK